MKESLEKLFFLILLQEGSLLFRGCTLEIKSSGNEILHLFSTQISKTAKELRTFIESMAAEDPILKGVPEDKNPFKEKGGCTIS